ncbi:MAG: tetratricopeptide repeat protein [Erythrobacter sp.]
MGSDANRPAEAGSGTNSSDNQASGGGRAGWILLGAAAVLAAGSIGFNLYDGGSDEPVENIASDGEPTLADLRAAAEASPDDAGPWGVLAYTLYEAEQFDEAVSAYERAVEIERGAAELWSALGEARVMAVDAASAAADPMPAIAVEAFERALELDPQDPRARFYMAVKKDIEGDPEGAITDWLALLRDSPPGAPWEGNVVQTIRQVGAISDIDVDDRLATVMEGRTPQVLLPGSGEVAGNAATAAVRGPSAQQVADASRMRPSEQRDMAVGMVEGLERDLQTDSKNVDRWVMLMRSRMQLGEPDKASAALRNAIAANPERAGELRAAAQQLGIR